MLSGLITKPLRLALFFLVLAFLLTPENLGFSTKGPSPVIFSFIFNLILENNLSLKTLRPLLFTLPFSLFLALVIQNFKKRFL